MISLSPGRGGVADAGERGAVAAAKHPVNSINTGTIVKTLAVRHIN